MMHWHWWQYLLCPMVAAAMVVFVLNCLAAVDATTIILSLVSTVAAKMPSLPPPLTAASIGNDCYCSH